MRIVAIVGTRTTGVDNSQTCMLKVGSILACLDPKTDVILSGGAKSGADHWARKLAFRKGFRYIEAPADWYPENLTGMSNIVDKSAGLKRNTTIAIVCTHCVAVWDGISGGTKDMISKVNNMGKPLWILRA